MMTPKTPPDLDTLHIQVSFEIFSGKLKSTNDAVPVNVPAARRRKVVARKAKSTTRPTFFLSEAILENII